MWLFRYDDITHRIPLGSDNEVHTTYKSPRYIKNLAQTIADRVPATRVYGIEDSQYTQKMCELSPVQFADHVRLYGKLLAVSTKKYIK